MLHNCCTLRCSRHRNAVASRSSGTVRTASATASPAASISINESPQANVCFVVPRHGTSPYKGASWMDVMSLMERRLRWENEAFRVRVFTIDDIAQNSAEFTAFSSNPDMLLAVGVDDHALVARCEKKNRPITLYLDSSPDCEKQSKINGVPVESLPPWVMGWLAKVPGSWGVAAKQWPVLKQMYLRRSSDDLAFFILLAINDMIMPVPSTQVNMGGDLASFVCMCTNCSKEIAACIGDPECKAALDALAECKLNDQRFKSMTAVTCPKSNLEEHAVRYAVEVSSYRAIASYEGPLLQKFSQCILQKHNCLGNHAEIPDTPNPMPLASFRGETMTHDIAEEILLGHLSSDGGAEKFSWRVVCGKNAAYDQFPCQYQIYYRVKGVGKLWYDPVFKVKTLDGREVWRRRHYRVRRGDVPGTFHYSVLDNGVTSNEFWRVMACAEDMSWSVFYYAGAASAAGISYRGALICSRSGAWPESTAAHAQIKAALEECGIELFEMFEVDNCNCDDAPLSTPADAIIKPVAVMI